MRGWQPSIAITSVVPERSAPIMMTGRSFSVMDIFDPPSGLLDVQVAQPCQEIDELLARRLLEADGHADLPEDLLAALARVQGDHRGAQPLDLCARKLRRGDHRHVDLIAAPRDHAPAVLLPAAAYAGGRVDHADVEESALDRPPDRRLVAHRANRFLAHVDLV